MSTVYKVGFARKGLLDQVCWVRYVGSGNWEGFAELALTGVIS